MLPPEPHAPLAPKAEAPATFWLEQLLGFLCYTVLRAVPRGLWVAGGGVLFSFVNLLSIREVWPNTPKAGEVFMILLTGSGMALPWLLGRTARRIAREVHGSGWRLLWQLIYLCCYAAAVLLLLPGLIIVFLCLPGLFPANS